VECSGSGLGHRDELPDAGRADLDVTCFGCGAVDVAGLGADEELLTVDLNLLEILVLLVLDGEVLHAACEVVLGGRHLAIARLGLLLGVGPRAHVTGHCEGLEVLVGLGCDVRLELGLELVGDLAVRDKLLEDLLLGSGPGDAALLLLLLLGSGRSLGCGLLGWRS